MQTPGKKSASAEASAEASGEARVKAGPTRRRDVVLRRWLRALHRDAGYLAVGLTFVYAASGIAVNHITDWADGDPSFANVASEREIGAVPVPPEADDAALASEALRRLGIAEDPREVYRTTPEELEILFDQRTLHVNLSTGHVLEEGQRPRFFLRVANWLHLNRGKKAWTYVADAYAAGLLFLATSGMFMIAGKKGLLGRGAVFVLIGIAVPVAYVALSGGP